MVFGVLVAASSTAADFDRGEVHLNWQCRQVISRAIRLVLSLEENRLHLHHVEESIMFFSIFNSTKEKSLET